MKNIYVCAYGDCKENKGIYQLTFDEGRLFQKNFLQIQGKANMVIETATQLITCVQYKDKNTLEFYDKETLTLLKSADTEYFYSYGQYVDDQLLLASYASGVDSVYSISKNQFIAHSKHEEEGKKAKSHYIQLMKDGNIVGIENGLQRFYIYKNQDLEIEKVIQYPVVNIRILSIHPHMNRAYMNTEITNELYVLDTTDYQVIRKFKLTEQDGFSGANALSEDGKYLCISVRGEDKLYIFENDEEGNTKLIKSFSCGKTPRDGVFIDHYLLMTCSDSNSIEVYDSILDFKKISTYEIIQPITFQMK